MVDMLVRPTSGTCTDHIYTARILYYDKFLVHENVEDIVDKLKLTTCVDFISLCKEQIWDSIYDNF